MIKINLADYCFFIKNKLFQIYILRYDLNNLMLLMLANNFNYLFNLLF